MTDAPHLQVGFELLKRNDFPTAAMLFCRTLKKVTAKAGHEALYHETISVAFLSLIAERSALHLDLDFEAFKIANRDLLDKSILEHWYSKEQLHSDVARKTFVLPEIRS